MRERKINKSRKALDISTPKVGSFLMEFATPGIGKLAERAGADFLFWDQQHTGWTIGEIREGIASIRGSRTIPGVRVASSSVADIGQALDCGAQMIMVPAVKDAAEAKEIVAATRYPHETYKDGKRAVTFSFSWDGYLPPENVEDALSRENQSKVVFVQIETREGLQNVEEIAAVEGIDVLWVGDNDLATSLGIPGEFDATAYLEALDSVADAANAYGKQAGFTTTSSHNADDLISRGYTIFAYGNDIKIFAESLTNGVNEFKERLDM